MNRKKKIEHLLNNSGQLPKGEQMLNGNGENKWITVYNRRKKIEWKEGVDERAHPREKREKASLILAGILMTRYGFEKKQLIIS